MFIKYLILTGRTFVATFFLVNFFNIIPFNFSSNAWFVQVSMLLVDTSSLLLLGLCCLKLASNLSINGLLIANKETKSQINNDKEGQVQKFRTNINVINKFAKLSLFFFLFNATLQIFIVLNGTNQLDLMYSENILQIEKTYEINKSKINSESKLDLDNSNQDYMKSNAMNLNKKDRTTEILTKQKNNSLSILIKNAMKVFLMSLVWAYGFFKLEKFS